MNLFKAILKGAGTIQERPLLAQVQWYYHIDLEFLAKKV